MGLLETVKGLLGIDASREGRTERTASASAEAGVTVEREPATATENAVKGTDAAREAAPSEASSAGESPAGTDASTDDAPSDTSEDPVTTIDGIGPAYEERLRDAGITSVAELATADPDALAADTDISSTRLTRWIDDANQQ